jgi:hypothetical protein
MYALRANPIPSPTTVNSDTVIPTIASGPNVSASVVGGGGGDTVSVGETDGVVVGVGVGVAVVGTNVGIGVVGDAVTIGMTGVGGNDGV